METKDVKGVWLRIKKSMESVDLKDASKRILEDAESVKETIDSETENVWLQLRMNAEFVIKDSSWELSLIHI